MIPILFSIFEIKQEFLLCISLIILYVTYYLLEAVKVIAMVIVGKCGVGVERVE